MSATSSFDLPKLFVRRDSTLRSTMRVIDEAPEHGLVSGLALVVTEDDRLTGIVTDGDLRRAVLGGRDLDATIEPVITEDPIVFDDELSYREILDEIPTRLREAGRYLERNRLEKVILVDEDDRPTRVLDFIDLWNRQSMQTRSVAVVGSGFVGLTLSVTLAEFDFFVTAVERNPDVRERLEAGEPHFYEAGLEGLLSRNLGRRLQVAAQPDPDAEVYVIAVGTPLDEDGRPQLEQFERAGRDVGQVLQSGDLVIVRSTVPVGITREVLRPILEEASGLTAGKDFYLACAPERTVEGRALHELRNLPQIVGGLDQNSTDLTANFFREFAPAVVAMDSLEAAETAKLINNSFRDLIFAFSNEVVKVCDAYDLDAHSIIRSANEGYPRETIPQPSPGVGGACLSKDPHIWSEIVGSATEDIPLSRLGRRINESMAPVVVNRVRSALESLGKRPDEASVFVIGFAFKGQPETSDIRESTTLNLLAEFRKWGADIRGYDPVVPDERLARLRGVQPRSLEEGFENADVAVIANNHSSYQHLDIYRLLESMRRPAVYCDCWRVFDPKDIHQVDGISYVGLGFTVPPS